MTPKTYVYAALAILAALAIWRGSAAIYSAGESAERQRWQEAAQQAEADSRAKEQADTAASEDAADSARQEASAAVDETRSSTTKTIETIRYVYRTQPASACPDARPLPDGVQQALREAHAALAAAR